MAKLLAGVITHRSLVTHAGMRNATDHVDEIEPTPILEGEDAKRFFELVAEDLKNPSFLIPTPRLEMAREKIKMKEKQMNVNKKIETLEKCREHWMWIAQNTRRCITENKMPSSETLKMAYFEEAGVEIGKLPEFGCYCCQYVIDVDVDGGSCVVCPLMGIAWIGSCTNSDLSLYTAWSSYVGRYKIEEAVETAWRMVVACDKALIDLRIKRDNM